MHIILCAIHITNILLLLLCVLQTWSVLMFLGKHQYENDSERSLMMFLLLLCLRTLVMDTDVSTETETTSNYSHLDLGS